MRKSAVMAYLLATPNYRALHERGGKYEESRDSSPKNNSKPHKFTLKRPLLVPQLVPEKR